jgi:adenine deaminase
MTTFAAENRNTRQNTYISIINAAKHFRIEHLVGSLSPNRWADFILADDLQRIEPRDVYFKGQQVVRDGTYVGSVPEADYPEWLYQTVTLKAGEKAEDFELESKGDQADVYVIDLYPDQIINRKLEMELPVVDGVVQNDLERDILKLAVVERHGKNGNIGISFVRGFGLEQGALASSVAHDHHNIIVAGTNDRDMAACARAIEEMQGGFAIAADGEVLGTLPLPIGGLLTEEPVEDVIEGLEQINEIYRNLGGTLPAPFMTISFIGLPTVPDLGLTDKGLVNVLKHKLMSSFVE